MMAYTYRDLLIAMFCGIFIWGYIAVHVRSIVLATIGVMQLFCCIPFALVIYHFVFNIYYFSLLHNLVIAIVLAVGADDIFVFNDNFKNAGKIPYLKNDINRRIAYTFRKSASAMMVTSLTTMVSFMSTSFTSIIPVRTFGLFAAIIIPINYTLLILVLPNTYVFYH